MVSIDQNCFEVQFRKLLCLCVLFGPLIARSRFNHSISIVSFALFVLVIESRKRKEFDSMQIVSIVFPHFSLHLLSLPLSFSSRFALLLDIYGFSFASTFSTYQQNEYWINFYLFDTMTEYAKMKEKRRMRERERRKKKKEKKRVRERRVDSGDKDHGILQSRELQSKSDEVEAQPPKQYRNYPIRQ